MIITVLNENSVYKRGFLAEHGMSVLIEYEGKRILFDTAQSDVFIKNAIRLSKDIETLDAIVLSHGHYDHCGGLEFYAEKYKLPTIYVRENAFENKKTKNEFAEGYREIGIPWRNEKIADSIKPFVKFTEDFCEIMPQVFLLGNIPYVTDFETVNKGMKIDLNGELVEDRMSDEQLLVIRSEKGLHVFAGCSHPGIINVLRYVEEKFPDEHIYSLYAGMHLISAKKEKLERVIGELEKRDIDLIMPVHCTGQKAAAAIKGRFGNKCRLAVTSDVIEI